MSNKTHSHALLAFAFSLFTIFLITIITPIPILAQTGEALELRVRGFHAQQRGSMEEAIDLYKRAAEADSTYATPHNDLGILYEDQSKFVEAEAEYRKATELDTNYAAAYTNLASLFDRQGRYSESLPLWRKRADMGDHGDRWRKQAEERIAEIESAGSTNQSASSSPAPTSTAPEDSTAGLDAAGGNGTEMKMAEQIASMIAQEQEAQAGGAAVKPAGFTTVKLTPPPLPGQAAEGTNDFYKRPEEAQADQAHNEEEVSKFGPEVNARFLLARAKVAIAANDYQKAVEILRRARQIDPDELEIDKLYWEAREKQIEEDITRSSIDSSVYNRQKIMEVEKKWYPPTPEQVEPFDPGKYIVQGSEKTSARADLEHKAKQIVPTIDFTDAKLKDVIEFLATSNDINIVIDDQAVSADEHVTVHLKNIPLDEALDIILRTKGLKYRLEENIIWITSAERLLEEDLEVRVYDVQDLVGKLYDFPSEPFDFEKFVETGSKEKSGK